MPDDSLKKGADGDWVFAHRVHGLFPDPSGSSVIMAHLPPTTKPGATKPAQAHSTAAHALPGHSATPQPTPSKPATAKATPAPEPRSEKWYYISNHNKVGPLDFDELIGHGRQGLVKPDSRVWSTASPKWHVAKDIKGLILS